jgi:acetylornithine deacetylase/succinyl-diaminopimelate desuccinylase-like protein
MGLLRLQGEILTPGMVPTDPAHYIGPLPKNGRIFMNDLKQYLDQHQDSFQQDLLELLRIPSISADRHYREDVHRAAGWVLEQFQRLGVSCELMETEGHPMVYAETPPVPGAPTVLVYGHYDVQPVDPLDEWVTPPFEPDIRDGNVHARGATDDKGQMLTHIKSLQAWMESGQSLPIQLKYLIEGEEEVGSESLSKYLASPEAIEKLASDVLVISDSSQFAPGQPAITYGLKGLAYFELRLRGPSQDLHSGSFGGAVSNPANALARILASIIDKEGRVQIPGFYDDVIPLAEEERRQFDALPFDEARFRRQIGVEELAGEIGYSTLERRWARPTYDINGMWSGYQGEGSKTVLPARAGAKFSFRLVPNQDPIQVARALRKHIEQVCPPGIRWELLETHGGNGYLTPHSSPYLQAASRAIEQGFGTSPVLIREGGSIPIVTEFHQRLGVDALLLGWGLDDDNTHSPNEKFCLADFQRGIRASAYLWHELGKLKTAT